MDRREAVGVIGGTLPADSGLRPPERQPGSRSRGTNDRTTLNSRRGCATLTYLLGADREHRAATSGPEQTRSFWPRDVVRCSDAILCGRC